MADGMIIFHVVRVFQRQDEFSLRMPPWEAGEGLSASSLQLYVFLESGYGVLKICLGFPHSRLALPCRGACLNQHGPEDFSAVLQDGYADLSAGGLLPGPNSRILVLCHHRFYSSSTEHAIVRQRKPEVAVYVPAFLRDYGQNIVSEAQLKKLTAQLQSQIKAAGGYPLFLAVHEEGGAYSRVASKLGYPQVQSAPEVGFTRMSVNARTAGAQIGAYLTPFGINLDFAPVGDVQCAEDGWINGRLYGSDPQLVSQMAFQMAEGLRSQGIIPCFSHFPGQASINGNLNNREVVNTRTLDDMRAGDWATFRLAASSFAEMIMVSHGTAKAAGDGLPASLSPTVIGTWLRKELGYTGVVITDSLRMGAITSRFKSGKAAVMALQAGADLLLLPSDADAAVTAILKAVESGELTEARIDQSVTRVLALKIEKGIIR